MQSQYHVCTLHGRVAYLGKANIANEGEEMVNVVGMSEVQLGRLQ